MKRHLWKKLGAWILCAAAALSLCAAAAAEENGEEQPALSTPPAGAVISDWAVEEVNAAYAAGLIPPELDLGTDYGAPISREAFARLTVELVAVYWETDVPALLEKENILLAEDDGTGVFGAAAPSFSDTDSAYVELAASLGIVQGSNIGTFGPQRSLTRAEAAVMLRRTMDALGCPDANAKPKTYTDAYTIPRWAAESVKYISGRTTEDGRAVMGGIWGKFMPQGVYSTEQAILTVLRCYQSAKIDTVYENWRSVPGYDTVSITLSFGGDCTFGRSRNAAYAGSFDEMYDKMGAAYFFSNLKAFQNDDLSMVNFEGALTTCDVPREDKEFIFKGRAEYAKILREGSIDVVTIANNHARDYGNQGLTDTVNNLSPYVAVSGYDRLPVLTVKGVKVGFASNLGWSFDGAQKKFITDSIKTLRDKGAEIIVFNYHWGVEREYHSNATQRAIAHYCIDSGADLVIGHHPHVVQEVETYKGKQIAYSLGNLCFGGNRNPSDKNCMIFRQTFMLDLDQRTVVSSTYQALPYKISSVNYKNDYRPTPA